MVGVPCRAWQLTFFAPTFTVFAISESPIFAISNGAYPVFDETNVSLSFNARNCPPSFSPAYAAHSSVLKGRFTFRCRVNVDLPSALRVWAVVSTVLPVVDQDADARVVSSPLRLARSPVLPRRVQYLNWAGRTSTTSTSNEALICLRQSAATTVTVVRGMTTDGTPVITPVNGSNVSPAGSLPPAGSMKNPRGHRVPGATNFGPTDLSVMLIVRSRRRTDDSMSSVLIGRSTLLPKPLTYSKG